MNGGAEALLSLEGLSKRFGAVCAVQDLDLTVRDGDIYGFLGLNGAGKTTTLRMALGLIRPDSGSIQLFGRPVPAGSPLGRQGLGALVEGPAFHRRLSGLDNVRLLGSLSAPVSRRAALSLLEQVGLGPAARRAAGTYSLGMKQRLGIALALAGDPRLVILDEPTNGLDPQGIRDIRDLVRRLARDAGLTFLVSSHLLSEVEQICTRVGVIRAGCLVVEENLDELLGADPAAVEVVIADVEQARRILAAAAPGAEIECPGAGRLVLRRAALPACEINRLLVEAGLAVMELRPLRPSLEQLVLTGRRAGEQPC